MDQYEVLKNLKCQILDRVQFVNEENVLLAIHNELKELSHISASEKTELKQKLFESIFKYDVIQPLLDDEEVSEIMINGPYKVFVEKKGKIEITMLSFSSFDHLMSLIHKIATEIDRPINIGMPILDARLKDGSRVNIILNPIALNGPTVTIRKFKKTYNDPNELVQNKMFPCDLAVFFKKIIECKMNIFICGSTGSGKTTLLNCLTHYIDGAERIVTIEDAAELQIQNHENLITLEVRKSNSSQTGISIATLIKNSLRMRPDRIIVGEVRGEEVIDMLQAMNTGHEGSLSTGHANSSYDMLTRLEVIASSHSNINHTLIRRQIISAIDIIIFVERLPSGERKVTDVSEIVKASDDYYLNNLYDYYLEKDINYEDIVSKLKNNHKIRRLEL